MNGTEEVGCVLGDFCIDARYRSLGPALQLQKACLSPIDAGTMALSYDFPSRSMMSIYKRLNIVPHGQFIRFAKPLRVDRKLRQLLGPSAFIRGLSMVGNLVLELSDRGARVPSLMISFQQQPCGAEFTGLAQTIRDRYGVCIQRTAEYLNWRYFGYQSNSCQMLTARLQGQLVAYAAFTQAGEDAALVDLFGVDEPGVVTSVVAQLVEVLRVRGVVTLSVSILETHPWTRLLRSIGFRPRDASPFVTYTPPRTDASKSVQRSWFLMGGDRDS
jgi:hypothetical protein